MNFANARKYGEILLGITRGHMYNHYTVFGSRNKTLLDFYVSAWGSRTESGFILSREYHFYRKQQIEEELKGE